MKRPIRSLFLSLLCVLAPAAFAAAEDDPAASPDVAACAADGARIADLAMRMQQSGVATRLIWISDDVREESMTMLERMRMAGVQALRQDPWGVDEAARRQAAAEADFDDEYDI